MDGWLILDKAEGMTSTQAGGAIKRLFHQKKIGHAGTLDPFACGVLPLALGEATKTMPFLMNRPKSYKFTLSFGTQTATGDTEGEVIATSAHRPTMNDIESALSLFTGSIQQTPSIYSAIKIKGKPAYARARAGEDIDMPSRQVEIYELSLENYDGESATLNVLDDIPAVSVSLHKAVKIRHGQAVEMDEVNSLSISVLCDDKLIALGHVQDNMFYPNRVFNI